MPCLGVAGATGRHVTRWEQVFFYFFLVRQSRKRVAEPHPWLKRIQTPHSSCCDFGGDKTFTVTTRWSGGRVQVWVQVWVQVLAPAGHLAISPEAVPEGNRRFRGQNRQALGAALRLARVGRASTSTGRFRVCGSRCEPQPACLIKTCYSCDTNSVQESTRF